MLAGVLGGCGDDGAGGELADPELELGRQVYDDRCAVCHGSDGQGAIAPATGGGLTVQTLPDVADHIDVVTNGRSTMPSWGDILTVAEIEAVVRYQREELGR